MLLKALVARVVPGRRDRWDDAIEAITKEDYIDRTGIERNAGGCEEPHSDTPSLWQIGEAEVDLTEGHSYVYGQQLWYLASRAHERIARGQSIAAQPMNHRARLSGIAWIPEPPAKEVKELEPGEEERLIEEDAGAPELPGLDGLDQHPPQPAVAGPSGVVYDGVALCCLEPAREPRRTAIRLIEHRWFDPLILLTIVANCITMAWESPLDPCCTFKASLLDLSEWVFLAIFTVELLAKVTAYGLIATDGAYLKDAWCQLDFVVVTLAWLPILFPSFGNYSVVRSIRALRPLRALKRMPGMPVLVNSIMAALPEMSNVACLCALFVLVVGIVGTQLFKGTLHYRCAAAGFHETGAHPTLTHSPSDATAAAHGHGHGAPHALIMTGVGVASVQGDEGILGGAQSTIPQRLFDSGIFCNPALSPSACPAAYPTCAYFDSNRDAGVTTFDHLGWTVVVILQTLTFDGWTSPMYALLEATTDPLVIVFSIVIVFAGGFFIVNMFLAVLFSEFLEAQAIERTAQLLKERALALKAKKRERAEQKRREKEARKASREARRRARSGQHGDTSECGSPDLHGAGSDWCGSPGLGDSPPPKKSAAPSPLAMTLPSTPAPLHIAGHADQEGAAAIGAGAGAPAADGALELPSWRRVVGAVAYSEAMSRSSTGLVVLNLVLMCLPYEGMSDTYAERLESYATLISWLFITEMALKLVGGGCARYWGDGWNTLDGVIVIMSIVEMVLTAVFAGSGVKLSFLRILRMLRIARMLRLMKSWKGLYKIVMTVMNALPQMSNVLLLMVLINTIFALLGMQLFGGIFNAATGYEPLPGVDLPLPGYDASSLLATADSGGRMLKGGPVVDGEAPPLPRYNFDYFVPAMLSVFVLTTGSWFSPMVQGVGAVGPSAALYYIAVMAVGTYILVNLFVAILLQLFSADDDGDGKADAFDTSAQQQAEPPAATAATASGGGSGSAKASPDEDDELVDESRDMALWLLGPRSELRYHCRAFVAQDRVETLLMLAVIVSSCLLVVDTPRLEAGSALAIAVYVANVGFTLLFAAEAALKIVGYGFYWTRHGYLRDRWNALDFSLLCISVGSILSDVLPQLAFLKSLRALRALRPLRLLSRNEGMRLIIETLGEVLPAVTNVFGVVLALQVVFAILGMQMFSGTFATCSDPDITRREQCVDFATGSARPSLGVATDPALPSAAAWEQSPLAAAQQPPSILSAFIASVEENASTPLGLTPPKPLQPQQSPTVQRPLRSLSNASASPPLLDASPQLAQPEPAPSSSGEGVVRGRRSLQGRSGRALKGGSDESEDAERVWANPTFGSFDDFGSSMLLLLVLSSGDNWDSVMYHAMDGPVEVGERRERNDSSGASLFFVVWMFVGSFFAMQLFVGVVVDQFNTIKARKDGSATMTAAQAQWVETMKSMGNVKGKGKPRQPTTQGLEGQIDRLLYGGVTSQHFQAVVMGLVAANVCVLGYDHWGLSADPHAERRYRRVLDAFSALFYLEAAVKWRIYGRVFYARDEWCRFEQKLVALSLLEQSQLVYAISAHLIPLPPLLLRVPSALLALRVLRLVSVAKPLEKLVTVALLSVPSLVNVTSLLLLVLFIYSSVAVQLFTFLPHGTYVTDDRNFDTFGHALLVNLQCLTGDSWSTLMGEAREDSEVSPYLVDAFFVSFQIVCGYVITNILVAVILENFTAMTGSNSDLISADDVELFSEVWADFDPDASQSIRADALPDLLRGIPQPMGLEGAPRTWVVKVCLNLGLEARRGQLPFAETLQALVRFNYMMQCSEPLPGDDGEREEAEEAAEAAQAAQAGIYKASSTSILWSGAKVSDEQRRLAELYALELLRLSAATDRLRAHMRLPRAERWADRMRYQRERAIAIADLERVKRESRELIVSALMADPSKVLELFRSWDEDGDGEISHSEFQKAMPRLGVTAKYAQLTAHQ